MIVMMCGKGGCGKSTVTALLANALVSQGKKVIVIDLDESNYGLYRQLGLDLPKDFTLYFGTKKGIFHKLDHLQEGEKLFPEKWSFDTLPSEFVSGNDRIRLLAIGKIHDAGEGCACPMGSLAKELLSNLELKEDEIVLVDAEAGVEHFGRGVDAKADRIFMIVDPSFESVSLSEKIRSMCNSLGKKAGFILNKVGDGQEEILRKALNADCDICGCIRQNPEIMTKGLLGEKLDLVPEEISEISGRL